MADYSAEDPQAYAERLVHMHGYRKALTWCYAQAYGLDEHDAQRCGTLAHEGDAQVLKARSALVILRSLRGHYSTT